ncbi:hypothetical protein KY312_03880 [Candidatus Woesearchaeota archaeon]|nr:hypothetical protein [Candidatus Woesearchaeota archaeon]
MKLEEIYEDLKLVVEEAKGNIIGKLKFQFVKAGEENRNKNNRWYSEKIVQKIINQFNAENANIAGQVNHPEKGRTKLDKVSHVLTSLSYNPATKIGTAEAAILNTSSGKDMKVLIQQNLKNLGASLRGFGEIEKDGKVKEDNYQFGTIDLVLNPSFKNASVDSSNLFESGNKEFQEAKKGNVISLPEFNQHVEKVARHAFFNLLPMKGATEEDFEKYLNENWQRYADAVETELKKAGKKVEEVKQEKKTEAKVEVELLLDESSLERDFQDAKFSGYSGTLQQYKEIRKRSTTDMLRYKEAKQSGFTGSFDDFKKKSSEK